MGGGGGLVGNHLHDFQTKEMFANLFYEMRVYGIVSGF